MIILGLTGSIGMGKSTAAAMLRRLRVPVHDADAAAHAALEPGGAAVEAVGALHPPALKRNRAGQPYIDRKILGAAAQNDRKLLRRLEEILHPRVRESERRFLERMRRRRQGFVALDIPLLFETGAQRRVDVVIVASAPAFLQKTRVLARPGMTPAKFRALLARQMSDVEKRRRAGFVLPTGLGRAVTFRRLKGILMRVKSEK